MRFLRAIVIPTSPHIFMIVTPTAIAIVRVVAAPTVRVFLIRMPRLVHAET